MTRDEIFDEQLLERYVTNRLEPEKRDELELLLLENPQYLDEVDAISRMNRGLRTYAANRLVKPVTPAQPSPISRLLTGWGTGLWRPAPVFALLVILALPLVSLLHFSREEAQPGINTAFIELGTNSRQAADIPRITAETGSQRVVLSVVLPYGSPLYDHYVFTLSTDDSRVLWQSGKLLQDYRDRLLLDFPRKFLPAGHYSYEVKGVTHKRAPDLIPVVVGRFIVED